MSLPLFLHTLAENGHVRVGALEEHIETSGNPVATALEELDQTARPQLAFEPPGFVPSVAAWSATLLYRACQFLVYREAEELLVTKTLSQPCPAPAAPDVCYSADLTLRYLPDILKLARGIKADDPLVTSLIALAHRWPLSSVGAGSLDAVDISPFWDSRSLRFLYVDRILERRDLSRLQDDRVKEAARAALGIYPELCAEVAAAANKGENAGEHR